MKAQGWHRNPAGMTHIAAVLTCDGHVSMCNRWCRGAAYAGAYIQMLDLLVQNLSHAGSLVAKVTSATIYVVCKIE